MPELLLPGDKALVLDDEPRLDEAALLAFLGGHCHSLAMALHEQTGWQLVAIDDARDGTCVHIAVRRPDGKIVDLAGAHTVAEIAEARAGGAVFREVTNAELADLHASHGWAEPVPQVAAPWAELARQQADQAPRPPMATATYALSRTTVSGIEVRVCWDGEPCFLVDVRKEDASGDWNRYGVIGFPRERDGKFRYSFTLDWFQPRAERWLINEFDESRARQVIES